MMTQRNVYDGISSLNFYLKGLSLNVYLREISKIRGLAETDKNSFLYFRNPSVNVYEDLIKNCYMLITHKFDELKLSRLKLELLTNYLLNRFMVDEKIFIRISLGNFRIKYVDGMTLVHLCSSDEGRNEFIEYFKYELLFITVNDKEATWKNYNNIIKDVIRERNNRNEHTIVLFNGLPKQAKELGYSDYCPIKIEFSGGNNTSKPKSELDEVLSSGTEDAVFKYDALGGK